MRQSLLWIGSFAAIGSFAVLAPTPTESQTRWHWPEKSENLKVLPEDTSSRKLRAIMSGFTRALGVRCEHCHVGEAGQSLSTFDFVSDENPNKNRAREMLRMLGSVNDHLDKIEPSGPERTNMWCHTCHHGTPRPMRLEEALLETYASKGTEDAVNQYRELRERYYGRGAYDFGQASLNVVGYEMLGQGDVAGAREIFTINTEQFPESPNTWDSLAEAHMIAGETERAIELYEKVLQMDPESQNARDMLAKLRGTGTEAVTE
ncbi:MAG: hypothetical protein DHS20C21_20020 [Gemmatimonadota bacterium]|nr:MAG: hypothetical protein DHS20C21_20020 [Gemmatimonadota bacterium]